MLEMYTCNRGITGCTFTKQYKLQGLNDSHLYKPNNYFKFTQVLLHVVFSE